MKIGIFTQFNEPFRKVADLTAPVMREYARRHGYDIHITDSTPVQRSIVWDRYRILAEHIEGYDWVVHMDADVLLTNLCIRLEEFLRPEAHVVISKATTEDGRSVLNDGVAFFRNTRFAKWLISDAFQAPQQGAVQCGQDYLQEVYDSSDWGFHVERQKAINSFLYTEYGMPPTTLGHWTKGDFVLHLPGRTNDRRVELFSELQHQIIL